MIAFFKRSMMIGLCVISFNLAAAANTDLNSLVNNNLHSWSLITSIGYTNYNHMLESDGQTALLRVAFSKRFITLHNVGLGLELGIQNGNTMDVDTSAFPETGGVPVSTTVKPPADILLTAKSGGLFNTPVIAQLKGGIAYYHWQFDNNDVMKNQIKIASELQAGVGYILNEYLDISLLYQGIFGGHPRLLNRNYSTNLSMDGVPVQHGILLSMSLTL